MSKTFAQARGVILEHVEPLGKERIALADAVGRVLASAMWGGGQQRNLQGMRISSWKQQ